jgi:hypothetical protein
MGNGVSLSVPVYVTVIPRNNWGVITESLVIATPEPQPKLENAVELRLNQRNLMAELANEFAVMHDDLLRELAR